MQAVILIGIQGSGKSTFYDRKFAATHLRVSRDLAGTRAREKRLVTRCVARGLDFVIDDTNATPAQRKPWIEAARSAGYRVIGCFFPPDLKGCLDRNARRSGKARIPVPGIYRTLKILVPPKFEEGFDELYQVRPREDGFAVTPIGPGKNQGVSSHGDFIPTGGAKISEATKASRIERRSCTHW